MIDPVAASPDGFDRKPDAEDYPTGSYRRHGDRVILFARRGAYYAKCPYCGEFQYRQAWQKFGRWLHVRTGFARCEGGTL
jgi:hypothetical protein